ncbi:hypothetical protein CASFOL_031374 [Castilleja foliolosa]|uniref:Uncharacterized protein n=1 Tax=Castilleja foliolosa TaxID=1961234 RepID=A0ABD3C5T7_9LAMI
MKFTLEEIVIRHYIHIVLEIDDPIQESNLVVVGSFWCGFGNPRNVTGRGEQIRPGFLVH